MKNSLSALIFLVTFSLLAQASIRSSTTLVSVEVELEKIENVKNYEIEVKKTSDANQKILRFVDPDGVFKIKIGVGNYLVRTRIISLFGETGPWSDWSQLLARPEEVATIESDGYNVSVGKKQLVGDLFLKWNEANGADKYVVWVEDLINKSVSKVNVKQNNLKLNLKVGEYRIGVQSVSKDGIRSLVKYSDNPFFVATTRLPKIQVSADKSNYKWAMQKDAQVRIETYRKSFFSDKFEKVSTQLVSASMWSLPHELKAGEYKIDFQYVSETFENGPIHSAEFIKKPVESDFAVTK